MNKFEIDTSIVSPKWQHGNNWVDYVVYTDATKHKSKYIRRPKDVIKEQNAKEMSGYCFSKLLSTCNGKSYNRICYQMQEKPTDGCPALSIREKKLWVRLAKAMGLLPSYVSEKTVDNGELVINLHEASPAQVYMYLSAFRYFREEAGLVKAMLHLVNEKGMNPYAAFVVATRICTGYSTHHSLNCVRFYTEVNKTPYEITYPLHQMIGIQRFCSDPLKHDPRKVGEYCGSFDCNTRIDKISKVSQNLKIQDLLDEDVIAAIMSKTDKEAEKHMNKFNGKNAK